MLCKDGGTALLSFDAPRFREARPEHIQKMLQGATGPGGGALEQEWVPLDCQPGASAPPSGKVILVGASDDLSKKLASRYPAAACVAGGASLGNAPAARSSSSRR